MDSIFFSNDLSLSHEPRNEDPTPYSPSSFSSKVLTPDKDRPLHNTTLNFRSDSAEEDHSRSLVEYPISPLSSTSTYSLNPNLFLPTIQNIIASAHLQCEIDLRNVAISTRSAEYNPRKVNAVIIRIRNPRCTGLIFRTGRLMITGAKSEAAIKKGGKLMAKLVQLAAHPTVRFTSFKIENIIATVDCGFPIRLEGLANEHKEFCNYEPELFAGLVYRYNPSEHIKSVLLMFVSGKIVITGCKKLVDAANVFENMFPVIVQFKK